MDITARWIIALSASVMPIVASGEERFVESFAINKGEEAVLAEGGMPTFYDFEISAAIRGNRNVAGLGDASWGVLWRDDNDREVMRVGLQWGNDYLGDPFDRRFLRIVADSLSADGHRQMLLSRDFYDNVGLFGDYNCLTAECDGASIKLWIGSGAQCYAGVISAPVRATSAVVWSNHKLKVGFMAWRQGLDPAEALTTGADIGMIEKSLELSSDPVEGMWQFLDRDTDTRWADIGGNYRVAVVRHGCLTDGDSGVRHDGEKPVYDILLVGGATVNGSRWKTGMIKGYLYGTVFENHYDLEWFDSMMEPMGDEVSADISDGVILSLNFPLYHAIVRLSKEPR